MSGVTDAPFRRLTAALGAGLVVSEMTASNDLVQRPPDVAACDARRRASGSMSFKSRAAKQNGWRKAPASLRPSGADMIDINMGCPARHVTGGQSGSALMRDLDHALKLIEATIAAVKVPVTLKMRLGWDDRYSQRAGIGAQRAEAAGVRIDLLFMAAHVVSSTRAKPTGARFARSGMPLLFRWSSMAISPRSIKAVTALEMLRCRCGHGRPRRTGAALAARPDRTPHRNRHCRVRTVACTEQLKYIRALYDEVCSHYGLRIGLRHARKHLGWALEIAAQCSRAPAMTLKSWKQKVLTSEEPASVHRALEDAFDDFAWSAAA